MGKLSALIRFVCLGGTRQPSCVLESSISLFLLEEIEKKNLFIVMLSFDLFLYNKRLIIS